MQYELVQSCPIFSACVEFKYVLVAVNWGIEPYVPLAAAEVQFHDVIG